LHNGRSEWRYEVLYGWVKQESRDYDYASPNESEVGNVEADYATRTATLDEVASMSDED
jgi:hypothetical protein